MGNIFIALSFYEVQGLMDKEGFDEHSLLINDSPLLEHYGTSAYMVDMEWLNRITEKAQDEFLDGCDFVDL